MGAFQPSPNEDSESSTCSRNASMQTTCVRSDGHERVHRERLVENGSARSHEGWLISSKPRRNQDGESHPWHESFWDLRTLLRRTLWRTMAPVAGASSLFCHGRENGDPDQTGWAQSKRADKITISSSIRNNALRLNESAEMPGDRGFSRCGTRRICFHRRRRWYECLESFSVVSTRDAKW